MQALEAPGTVYNPISALCPHNHPFEAASAFWDPFLHTGQTSDSDTVQPNERVLLLAFLSQSPSCPSRANSCSPRCLLTGSCFWPELDSSFII